MKTLLAASGGGHLAQLRALAARLPFDCGDVTWFTFDTPQSRSMLAGESVVYAQYAAPRDLRAAAANARLALSLCRSERFDAAVSTGASVAVSTLPAAAALGARACYIESSARVLGPSLSGKMMRWCPGVETFCQYRSWARGPWRYAGSVFDAFAPGPERSGGGLDRVVVTLGSQQGYPFDRLVERLAHIVPEESDVLWQTGATDVERFGIQGVSSMPAADLGVAMAAADLVVAHAGVGSALAALEAGRHPILVARRSDAGEHIDDHQLQIAAELTDRGLATACEVGQLDREVLERASRLSVVPSSEVSSLDLG